ncbi:2'-5' RNA ligase family protein [Kineosporia sp. NBRC 101731]|uniref:2'-5' RNA ligase family protein n=1 Tax=Kineosporia sp. NBRC 101731 TaxID=3032199 RepID=UPI0024A1F621|nr:2'-5' RNA ligase family protein [Kineosporia sp. NBRC 101731]GLY27445.1 hypothetical protein Kisp02_08100 [Kineosporia sp. NBRC 101731]
MTQSLELLLDPQLDAAVREQWQRLIDAGLPSQGRHTGSSNAPHITLTVASSVPEPMEDELHDLVGRVPVRIGLGGLQCFGRPDGRQIIVRPIVVNQDLLRLQEEAARRFDGLPGTDRRLTPGHWSPHVTLGHKFTPQQVGEAIEVLGPMSEREGEAIALRRWNSDARQAWLLGPSNKPSP